MTVHTLEVVLLAARSGNCKAELQEDREATEGQDAADDPEEERYTNGTGNSEDAGRCRKD